VFPELRAEHGERREAGAPETLVAHAPILPDRAGSAKRGSARAEELLLDPAVGARVRRKLLERFVEEAVGLLAVAVASVDEAEVRDHAPLVLDIAQLSQDNESLLEETNRRSESLRVDDGEREVVQGQRLGALVVETADEGESGAVLLGRAFVMTLAPELSP